MTMIALLVVAWVALDPSSASSDGTKARRSMPAGL
jgi:hypothetical protein